MRDILFKGRDKYTNEWFYGFVEAPHTTVDGVVESYYFNSYVNGKSCRKIISADTLGQYTGLTDKNGNKIFEGDIVDDQEFIGVVKYNEIIASFVVEINDTNQNYYHWSPLNMGDPSREKQLKYTEIVGNLHDNPELLKEAEQ